MGRRLVGLALCLVLGCAQTHEDDVADNSSEVQSSSETDHWVVATTDLPGATGRAQRATGALLVPRRSPSGDDSIVTAPDGTPIRSTCGVTFITPTHAITAAHCADEIDVPDPLTRTLTVELYDVAPTLDWKVATKVEGTYPDYKHTSLRGQPGYSITPLTCSIASRCGFGEFNCPEPALRARADIMLLKCDPLPADRKPVGVAQVDDAVGTVKTFWFHEIYDAPMGREPAPDSPEHDLFLHYTKADPTGAQNLHYFGNDRNDLLPLVSAAWSSGSDRRRLGVDGTVVWTDLFGCHGTSGSGVMQFDRRSGEYVLLGPVATASNDWGHERLCTDPGRHRSGRANASYTGLFYTQALANLARSQP